MLTTIAGMNGSNGIVHGAIRLSDDDDRTDEELLDDLDLNDIAGVESLIRGIYDRIAAVKEEIDYDNDPEVDTAIQLDEIIHPLENHASN